MDIYTAAGRMQEQHDRDRACAKLRAKLVALRARINKPRSILDKLFGRKHKVYVGICAAIKMDFAEIGYAHRLWEEWPHYSGSIVFPVPAPHGYDPADYFFVQNMSFDMFDPATEYGRKRRDLLDFLIKELSP